MTMVLSAALSECGHQRQRGGRAPSFRGGLPGHSASIMGVLSLVPAGSYPLQGAHEYRGRMLARVDLGSSNGHVRLIDGGLCVCSLDAG